MAGLEPELEFAFDGTKLLGQTGTTGAVGNNMEASEAQLSRDDAKRFIDAFRSAKKQVAIKDGISDRPHLLTARGNGKAGAALLACIEKQKI